MTSLHLFETYENQSFKEVFKQEVLFATGLQKNKTPAQCLCGTCMCLCMEVKPQGCAVLAETGK